MKIMMPQEFGRGLRIDSLGAIQQSGLLGSKFPERGEDNGQIEDCADGIGDCGAGAEDIEGARVWLSGAA
jgi:hypothetical protein